MPRSPCRSVAVVAGVDSLSADALPATGTRRRMAKLVCTHMRLYSSATHLLFGILGRRLKQQGESAGHRQCVGHERIGILAKAFAVISTRCTVCECTCTRA
jgi:hypothetical protein